MHKEILNARHCWSLPVVPFWDLALPVCVSLVMFQTGRCISIRPCASLVNQLECTRKYWMLGTTGYSQLCHCETWPCQFVSHQLCFTLVDALVLYPVRHWWTSFNAQGSTKCYVTDKVIVSMTVKLAMLAWMSDCHFWPPPLRNCWKFTLTWLPSNSHTMLH